MRFKTLLLTCAMVPGILLAGCGRSSTPENGEKGQTAPEMSVQAEEGMTEAAQDPKTMALSAYRALLEEAPAIEGEHEELADASFDRERNRELFGEHYDLFALRDLNGDNVPELIALTTVNYRWTQVSVFSFAEGEAVLLKGAQAEPFSFEMRSTANGAYSLYFCEEGHIHSLWRGTIPTGETAEEDTAYAWEGSALLPTVCSVGESGERIPFEDMAAANTAEGRDALTD